MIGTGAVNVSATNSLTEALDLAAADAATSHGGTIAANTRVIDWFQYDGNTYIVESINTTASPESHSALAATDEVINIQRRHRLCKLLTKSGLPPSGGVEIAGAPSR